MPFIRYRGAALAKGPILKKGHHSSYRPRAKCYQAALKALELDETLAEGHSMMAVLKASDYDWKGAKLEFRRALDLNPRSIEVMAQYSFYYLMPMRRTDEVIAAYQKLLELDPISSYLHNRISLLYGFIHQWDQAAEYAHKTLELDSNDYTAYSVLAAVCFESGRIEEATLAGTKAIELSGHLPVIIGAIGHLNALVGRVSEAKQLLEELKGLSQHRYVSPSAFAAIYFGLGEIERGLDFLERAIDERDIAFFRFCVDPSFEPLLSHSRFQALLKKMNLNNLPETSVL